MSYGSGFFKPVIDPAAKSPVALSFINLIEAHVLAAIRRKHRIDMPRVRRTIGFLKKAFGSKHPLADHKFETNGVDLFVETFGRVYFSVRRWTDRRQRSFESASAQN